MRWWTFILFAVLTLTLQTSFAPRLAVLGVRPDWLLVIVVFFALHGRRRDAVLAGWSIGLCADLMSIERVGLLALSYTLVAWSVGLIRDYLFRHQALTQFVVTFVAALCVQIVWMVYRRTLYAFNESLGSELSLSFVVAPIYAAIWAPVAHRALLSAAPMLGLPKPRYSFAGSPSLETRRV